MRRAPALPREDSPPRSAYLIVRVGLLEAGALASGNCVVVPTVAMQDGAIVDRLLDPASALEKISRIVQERWPEYRSPSNMRKLGSDSRGQRSISKAGPPSLVVPHRFFANPTEGQWVGTAARAPGTLL